jgi:hypothetical protein
VGSQSGRLSGAFAFYSHDRAEQNGREQADQYDNEPSTIGKAGAKFMPQWIHVLLILKILKSCPNNR